MRKLPLLVPLVLALLLIGAGVAFAPLRGVNANEASERDRLCALHATVLKPIYKRTFAGFRDCKGRGFE